METIKEYQKKEICKKLDEILNLMPHMKENIIVGGGCIASMLRGEQVNDYDLFFTEYEYLNKFMLAFSKKYNVELIKINDKYCFKNTGSLINQVEDAPFKKVYYSKWSITIETVEHKLQYIIKDTYINMRTKFDFEHTKYNYSKGKLVLHSNMKYKDYDVENLVLWDSRNVNYQTIPRIVKFIKRGWKISNSEMYRVFDAIKEVDINEDITGDY
jgi:hypothetical protein